MERTISQEDRIRRAEEIYYNRRNNVNTRRSTSINLNSKKQYKLFKRVIVQVIVCVCIYFGIYSIRANTDDLSIDSIKYIKNTLAYDIDLEKWLQEGQKYLGLLYKQEENKEDTLNELQQEAMPANEVESEIVEETKEENNFVEDVANISQMEQDAKYIKENFSIIKPVEGEITSRFGQRNPTTETVPKFHTGIDIAVPEGTKFVAAMDGVVEVVSSEGDYRKPR